MSRADEPRSPATATDLPPPDALYDDAACGLLVTDTTGLVLRANATFCRWIGTQEDAIAGRLRFQDLLTVGGRIFHQTHWSPLLQMQGSISEVKLDIRHADGRALPMVMNAVRRGDPGQLRHELAVFAAGDRHSYEQELMRGRRQAETLLSEQQDRALFAEQMIGIVSHDLRSPLSAISLGTELLGRLEQDAQQTAIVQGLGRSARRARRLIDDLLDFTKARIGQGLPICVAPLDLHAVVANHVRELVPIYPGRVLEHVTRGDGPVAADPDRVFQIISNLVANAVAYGAPGAPIIITSTAGTDASVSVQNAGEPIPAALLPTLFQAMVRGDNHPSDTRSVGLGLYIVSEIARAHGGRVEVVSTAEQGTRFEVTIASGVQPAAV